MIFHIMRFSLHDGPGIRTTVFFKGCPLQCQWCHNPESQAFEPQALYFAERCIHCGDCLRACPHGIAVEACRACTECASACPADARRVAGRDIALSGILREIERDRLFFEESGGGITLSGGEPLAQAELAVALLAACRERRIHTALETCGAAPREVLLRAGTLADLVLFDLKLPDNTRHREYTGASNRAILDNLRALIDGGGRVEVRIPLIPGVNDREEDIRAYRDLLSGLRPVGVDLVPYHRAGKDKYERLGRACPFDGVAPPTADHLAAIAAGLSIDGVPVKIAG